MAPWELLFAIIPGIVLFLYGIEQFSHEVQLAAGDYFRNLIQRMTKTPVRGTVAGAIVTSIVQSSTATTVITVGLVNAGIIPFTASLGIIFGANVGTTLTSQLIALNLTAFAPVFILAGFVIGIIPGSTGSSAGRSSTSALSSSPSRSSRRSWNRTGPIPS